VLSGARWDWPPVRGWGATSWMALLVMVSGFVLLATIGIAMSGRVAFGL
jgi:hypothetical protein